MTAGKSTGMTWGTVTGGGLHTELVKAGSGKHGILKTGAWLQAQKRDNREASRAWGPRRGQHTFAGTGEMPREQLSPSFGAIGGGIPRKLSFQGQGFKEKL